MQVLGMKSGKTRFLLEYAARNHVPVITSNKAALEVKAQNYGIKDVNIIDFIDLDESNYEIGECVIHNGGELFEWMLDQYYGLTPTYAEMEIIHKEGD